MDSLPWAQGPPLRSDYEKSLDQYTAKILTTSRTMLFRGTAPNSDTSMAHRK